MNETLDEPWDNIKKVNVYYLEPFTFQPNEKDKLLISFQAQTIETTLYFYVSDRQRVPR